MAHQHKEITLPLILFKNKNALRMQIVAFYRKNIWLQLKDVKFGIAIGIDKFISFECNTQPFDTWYHNELNTNAYTDLPILVQVVSTLSHGHGHLKF